MRPQNRTPKLWKLRPVIAPVPGVLSGSDLLEFPIWLFPEKGAIGLL